MHIITEWAVCYLLPGIATLIVTHYFAEKKKHGALRGNLAHTPVITFLLHLGLLMSIALSQYFIYQHGKSFPINNHPSSIAFLIVSIALAYKHIGQFSLPYTLSSLIQELTMLSGAYLLLLDLPLWQVSLLIVPLYSAIHLTQLKHWQIKVPLTAMWGFISVLLFSRYYDLYVNVAVHTLIGAVLISEGIIYHKSSYKIDGKLEENEF